MITADERREGFNDKCEMCQCYHCQVDYAKLVGAPAWTSTLCKYGHNLNCDICRKEGRNRAWHHFEDAEVGTEETCLDYVGDEL